MWREQPSRLGPTAPSAGDPGVQRANAGSLPQEGRPTHPDGARVERLPAPGIAPGRIRRWLRFPGFRASSFLVLGGFVCLIFAPLVSILAGGRLFGADWSEYLYTARLYASHSGGLFEYPSPALPAGYLTLQVAITRPYAQAVASELVSGLAALSVLLAGYLCCRSLTGSRWSGLAGSVAISTFPLILYEVTWGGQAQLFSYSLGLLSLWIFVARALPARHWGWAVIAGLLLALATLTDLYAAGFLVLTSALFVSLSLRRGLTTRSGATVMFGAVGLPIATGLAEYWLQPSTTLPAATVTVAGSLGVASMYGGLWQTLTFGVPEMGAAYAAAAGAYVLYSLLYRSPTRSAPLLVLASTVAAVVVGASLTPLDISGRALYPLAFPFGFAVTELTYILPPGRRAPPPARQWTERRRILRHLGPVCAAVLILTTSIQVGLDVQTYPASLAHQSFPAGELSELFWLSHEPGAVLYDSAPVDHFFPVLWATGRSVYPGPAFQPYTVTSAPKQAAAVLATSLSYGEQWVNAGPFIVTGDEPAWGQPDPGIVLDERSTLLLSLEGNDFANTVGYSPPGQPNITAKTTLFLADSYSVSLDPRGWTETFHYDGFSLVKSIAVAPSGTLYWNYSFDFGNATPRFVQLYVTAPDRTPSVETLLGTNATGSTGTVKETFAFGGITPISQRFAVITRAVNSTEGTTLTPSNAYGIFQFEYDLAPATPGTTAFGLSVAIDVVGARTSALTVTNETTTLHSTGIQWIVLMKSVRPIILQRFFDDPLYLPTRTTAHYYILSAQ